jgi:hypothetical protein
MRTVLCLTERAAWRPFVARRGGEGREEIAGTEGEAAWRRLARRAKAGPSSRARAIAVATGKWAA